MTGLFAFTSFLGFAQKYEFASFADYPTPAGDLTEMTYSPGQTDFQLWAPTAEKVELRLYKAGMGGKATKTVGMKRASDGTWHATVKGNLDGQFYTFNVRKDGKWLGECPGINAHAVGVNGHRGAIIDLDTTDPAGWANDKAPRRNDIVIYEMHHRDFSIADCSGIEQKGKFVALTERGTRTPGGSATGIDHLRDLGVTHVHILPSYDYFTVDETRPDVPQYNWGYDPLNYNVPEGSYSTNAADPKARIREFKQMVQALHQNGMKLVLDVVYNHTMDIEGSNFHRTVPGYFFRQRSDGSWANGSGCGNETASDHEMMRRYMVESVKYWMTEYHVDGFRFDLMGIHDIETMNLIRQEAQKLNPDVLIYGEGWAAEAPQLPNDELAMKANVYRMPGIAAFSDDIRDALRGPFSDDHKTAFLGGLPGNEESLKFGIAGAIAHPQIDMTRVNYSKEPWTAQPHQMISYVSCHDDMCLTDRLRASVPNLSETDLIRLDLLAQTAVFTSQGIPFIQAGEEVLRDKKGVHNSYNSPDSINAIDWTRKDAHPEVFDYYRGLIQLRNEHPAFRMLDADLVRQHLEFLPAPDCVVAFRLKDHAAGDQWQDIIVVLNGNNATAETFIPGGHYEIVAQDARIDLNGLGSLTGNVVNVAPRSATILYSK
ncbi:MAG: type I pullulanase [Bacteroidales bacterium]|nr:type I pullulanase [Bacteroidales bacterium]